MTKKTKVILIVAGLLLIGGGVYALTRKKPQPEPAKKKPKKKAGIIIPEIQNEGNNAFSDYASGNYFLTTVGAKMWSFPDDKTSSRKLLKTYTTEDSVTGLQLTGSGDNVWIQVDDFDTVNNIGWIKESDLLMLVEETTT